MFKGEDSLFWSNFKTSQLKNKKQDPFFKTWIDSVALSQTKKRGGEPCFTLQVPSDLHKKWVQNHLLSEFSLFCNDSHLRGYKVQIEIVPLLPSKDLKPIQQETPTPETPQTAFFNPEYTFENFIVGPSNEFSYSASLEATKDVPAFNPLFLYGPSGLGKTHLLNAIGIRIQKERPETKIRYLSAERFFNECIQAMQRKEMASFRKKYRNNCDVLLVDDIQMLAKGNAVQEEFFHTFNDLYNRGSRIVFCCDTPPSHIAKLEQRIRTRLEGGLLSDISYPGVETRLAIIKYKMEKKSLFMSEDSCLKIAKACKNSIREIEGVLNKIKMMSELHGGALDSACVHKILEDVSQSDLTAEDIQKKVASYFNLSVEEMKSQTRKKNIVTARQTAMYFIKKHMKKSLSDVGRLFGKKDHTTVLNSIKKVEKLCKENPDFNRIFQDINKDIHNLKGTC